MAEAIPGVPGCLGGEISYIFQFPVYSEFSYTAPEPVDYPRGAVVPVRGALYSAPALDDGQIVRQEVPVADATGYWLYDRCVSEGRYNENRTMPSTDCLVEYRATCPAYFNEFCFDPGYTPYAEYEDEDEEQYDFGEDDDEMETPTLDKPDMKGYSGSFAVPEGARSFELAAPGYVFVALIDPNGRDYMTASTDSTEQAPIRILRNGSIAVVQATSDIHYSYDDIVLPGRWTFVLVRNLDDTNASVVLVTKTRNDPDDKIRLNVINATPHSNEAFASRLDRMVELAARLGFTLEISSIEQISPRDNPHDPPHDFCERFCSSNEAVVFITDPGGWSSPGLGIALRMPYNTHFLVGAEVATSENDHYLTAALHELLHYAAGLGHLYETHVDGDIDVDDLRSTGVHNEIVDIGAQIVGGVNYQRLRETGKLVWNDNILIGWRMTPNVRDVDGFGSDYGGRRFALVTFLEYHQLEWLKNSPLYW